MESDPHRELCKRCYKFYSALDVVFTNDPPLRVAYFKNFNEKGRRTFIFKSHRIPSELKYQWITTMLQCYTGILPLDMTKPQMFKARVATSQQNDTRADMSLVPTFFTQEHIHCHVVRYNMLMPHSDFARYRPSSHVVPARCNPFRFVKSAR